MKKNTLIIVFLLILFIPPDFRFNFQSFPNKNEFADTQFNDQEKIDTELPISLDNVPIFDDQVHQVIVIDENNEYNGDDLLNAFITAGGIPRSELWNYISGFAGDILFSPTYFGEFLELYPQVSWYFDPVVESYMNTIHSQIQTIPNILSPLYYGYQGVTNASTAIIDSGIDDSHIFFKSKYNQSMPLNFSQSIIEWQDFINGSNLNPIDTNGHGSAMAAIVAGGGSSVYESAYNPLSINESYMTIQRNFSHIETFFPDYLTPGIYRIKLAAFSMDSTALDLLLIQGIVQGTENCQNVGVELYRNGDLINESNSILPHLTWDTSQWWDQSKKAGLYEVFLRYQIPFGVFPTSSVFLNITFTPIDVDLDLANFSGIAPASKLTVLRILNSTGHGFLSDVITALEWVMNYAPMYHIITILLSFGSFSLDSNLTRIITDLIDTLVDRGIFVVIAAGNGGLGDRLNKLAGSKKALIVGAINDQDQVTFYSAQGQSFRIEGQQWYDNDELFRPDLVAPGGSLLPDHAMVITAENNRQENLMPTETILNDLTCVTGTSVAAAVVSGLSHLILEYFGGWTAWNDTNGLTPLKLKNLLLLSASETNLAREDDPSTSLDESNASPTVNRGSSDIHEGYGRINPRSILDALSNTFPMNATLSFDLTASSVDPLAAHVFAVNISLEQNQVYRFSLINEEPPFSTFDADLYLYDSTGDQYGRPILLAKSTETGAANENFYFTNLNSTGYFYLLVKALSGQGTLTLNVSEQAVTTAPLLREGEVYTLSSLNYSDLQDTFRFRVNYTHIGNLPPSGIWLHLNSTASWIPLLPLDPSDQNYANGAWFYADLQFSDPQTVNYSFSTILANLSSYLIDPSNYLLKIHPIHNLTPFPYSVSFTNVDNNWDYGSGTGNLTIFGFNHSVQMGWGLVSIPNSFQDRDLDPINSSWTTMYWGAFNRTIAEDKLMTLQNRSHYLYSQMNQDFSLSSPTLFLNQSKLESPVLAIGMCVNLPDATELIIEINLNRSSWVTLATFSEYFTEWELFEYDLTPYLGSYIQIHFQVQTNEDTQLQEGGIMLDLFAVREKSIINDHIPSLSPPSSLMNESLFSYYSSQTNSKFGLYTFRVHYQDLDANMPSFVSLEINGVNYSMINYLGHWNFTQGVVFLKNLYIFSITNTSFRFHCSDGIYQISSPWQPPLPFLPPSITDFPVDSGFQWDELTLGGEPIFESQSPWHSLPTGWHQLDPIQTNMNSTIWYCGIGVLEGYGENYASHLITPTVYLNSTRDLFLSFYHRLRFDSGGDSEGDYGEIAISSDTGIMWSVLEKFTTETAGLDSIPVNIDITRYQGKTVNFRFSFYSDDTGTHLKNSGWQISPISIDINRTKDYIPPEIFFLGLDSLKSDGNRYYVHGMWNFSIFLKDQSEIDVNRCEMWINDKLVPTTIVNNTLLYVLDVSSFENNQQIEIVCIIYDVEGNREIKKYYFYVDNPPDLSIIIFISLGSVVGLAFIVFRVYQMQKIKQKRRRGEIVPPSSPLEIWKLQRFKKKQRKTEAERIVDLLDPKWESKQIYKLYCKKCSKTFQNPTFELYCPHCLRDSLNIAKYCPVCLKWRFFGEDKKTHLCPRCHTVLIKDFKKAADYLLHQDKKASVDDFFPEIKAMLMKSLDHLSEIDRREILRKVMKKLDEEDTSDLSQGGSSQ